MLSAAGSPAALASGRSKQKAVSKHILHPVHICSGAGTSEVLVPSVRGLMKKRPMEVRRAEARTLKIRF